MPAVNLIELRKEINSLLWDFTNPEAFRDGLMKLIDQYRTLSFRFGHGVQPGTQTSEIRIPRLVLRELELALYQTIREQPQAALTLCDVLWQDANFEMYTIATQMLGQIPLEFSSEVLARIDAWSAEALDPSERETLIHNGAHLLRQREPDRLLALAQKWTSGGTPMDQERAVLMLNYLTDDPKFINLPAVFTLLEQLLESAPTILQPELTSLFKNLFDKSQVETSFFLRQMVEKSNPGSVVHRIARKLLPLVSAQSQEVIQNLLRSKHQPQSG